MSNTAELLYDCRPYYQSQREQYYIDINAIEQNPNYKNIFMTMDIEQLPQPCFSIPETIELLPEFKQENSDNNKKGTSINNVNNPVNKHHTPKQLLVNENMFLGAGTNHCSLYNNADVADKQYNRNVPSALYSFTNNCNSEPIPSNQLSTLKHSNSGAIRQYTDGYQPPYNKCDRNNQAALRNSNYSNYENDSNSNRNGYGYDYNSEYYSPDNILSENSNELCTIGTKK
jgi:hypothetical protein